MLKKIVENNRKYINLFGLKIKYGKVSQTKQLKQRIQKLEEEILNLESLKQDEWRKSYSQAGEDKIIDFIFFYFTNVDRDKVRYLDIGANYPIDNNNTYFYYVRNGKGVLVEPNKQLCLLAEEKRPRDIVINAGVKFNSDDLAQYYAFDECGLNTFDSSRVEAITSKGHKLIDQYKVQLLSVNEVLKQYFSEGVDYVSIDAEGVDIAILKSIDFKQYRPKLFCIEANKNVLDRKAKSEVIEFLESQNYVLMADTSINYIFLAKEELIIGKYC